MWSSVPRGCYRSGHESSTALMTAAAVSVVAAGQRTNAARCRGPCDGGGRDLPPRLDRPPRLSRQLAVWTSADRLYERHRSVDDRQPAGRPNGAPIDGGSVTQQLRSVVTHLHLVHPPTLARGAAVLAMLFVIAWRSALSGSVDCDDPRWRMRGVVRSRKQRDPHRWRGPAWSAATSPSLTGIDIMSLLPRALGIALVAYSDNIVTARALGARLPESVDNDQELLALGPQICPPPYFMASRSVAETRSRSAWTRTRPPSRSGAAQSCPRVRPAAAVVNLPAPHCRPEAATRDPDITETLESSPTTS
jgi:hypothetical protein